MGKARDKSNDGVIRLAFELVFDRYRSLPASTIKTQKAFEAAIVSKMKETGQNTTGLPPGKIPEYKTILSQGSSPWFNKLPTTKKKHSSAVDTQKVRLFVEALFSFLPGGITENLDIYSSMIAKFFYEQEKLGPKRKGWERRTFLFNECPYLVVIARPHYRRISVGIPDPKDKRFFKNVPILAPFTLDALVYALALIAVEHKSLTSQAKQMIQHLLEGQSILSTRLEIDTLKTFNGRGAKLLHRLFELLIGNPYRRQRQAKRKPNDCFFHYRVHWSSDLERATGQRSLLASQVNFSLDSAFRRSFIDHYGGEWNSQLLDHRKKIMRSKKDSASTSDLIGSAKLLDNLVAEMAASFFDMAFSAPFFTNLHEIRIEMGSESIPRLLQIDPLRIENTLDAKMYESVSFFPVGYKAS